MSELSTLVRSIGHKIRQCRLARNLTQEDLAKGLFSKSYISQLERGAVNPSLKALHLIAERLGVSSTWLLESSHSPPAFLIQAATTSFYLGDADHAKELLEMARVHQDSFTRRDAFEALLLDAHLLALEQRWKEVIDTCQSIETFEETESLPRRLLVTHRYLLGTAWFKLGNQRQAILQWEKGLIELNRSAGLPGPEGLSLLQSLRDLYASLGDQHASHQLHARLCGTVKQIKSPADLSRWVLARRRDQVAASFTNNYSIVDQIEDLRDAQAWARANMFFSNAAKVRKNLESEIRPRESKLGQTGF